MAGGCWQADKQQQSAEQRADAVGQAETDRAEDPAAKRKMRNSLKHMMSLGTSLKCTWEQARDDSAIKGTMYISGNKFMQDMQTSDIAGQDGKPYQFNALSDGEWFYSWNTMMPGSGMKFRLSELEAQSEQAANTDAPADFEEELDFECEPWSGSGDFTPPANMEFKDNTQMLKKMQENAAAGINDNDPCIACGMMPSEQLKDMCLKQNNCE